MIRTLTSSVVLLALAANLQAQERPNAPSSDVRQVVVVSEKSMLGASVLEWAMPTVGYAYAGNWSRGIPSALVRITGLVLVLDQQFVIFGEQPPCEGTCILGAALAVGGMVWAVVDAGKTARRENEMRRSIALGPTVVPTFGDAGPGPQVDDSGRSMISR